MLPFFGANGYNPSGLYRESRRARAALENARQRIADTLDCETPDVVFTGSGSEGANLAIKGAGLAARARGRPLVVTTAIEHHCVLGAGEYLQRFCGCELRVIPVQPSGLVDPDRLAAELDDRVGLVSIIYANNEIGVIQDIPRLARLAHEAGAVFHTDAVQAIASCPAGVDELGVDLLSIAAHKFYGPKGVGALYVRPGTRVIPQVQGGDQENRRRAGTENVALAVGLAEGLALARRDRERNQGHALLLRRRLQEGLSGIDGVVFNGDLERRLANNTNICIEGVSAEKILLELDRAGIAASSGSACTVASAEPSHVLLALGRPPELARGSLRITTGPENTVADIDRFLDSLAGIVRKVRGGGHSSHAP
jgi:cysteine desulfurase